MAPDEPPPGDGERLRELRASARGWHGVQLAVLGFIGLCGVLLRGESPGPEWVQVLAGVLALAALSVACLAAYLVGRAAWPLYRVPADAHDDDLVATSRRLTSGLRLTFVAVALLALSAASGWWPGGGEEAGAGRGVVELQAAGSTFCGTLEPAQRGVLRIVTGDRDLAIPIGSLTQVRSVDGCD